MTTFAVEQPYSMCPLLRSLGHDCRLAPQAMGGARAMDFPERQIATMLIAPKQVQRAARDAGMNGVMMVKIKGLDEAFKRAGLMPKDGDGKK